MTQPTEQQGNQPEPAEQPVYQPAQHGPRNFLLQPRNSQRQFRDNRYRNSQWPCHHLRNRLCRSRNNRPVRSGRADCGCAFAASTVDLRHGDSYRQHGDCAVAMAGRILPPLPVGVACFGRHHSDCGSRAL